jgi:nucleoside 2-deoxyribosyltransferase
MAKVYLAGPIKGLTYGGATDWRTQVEEYFKPHGIEALSPMRGKEDLKNLFEVMPDQYESVLSTSKAIVTRDHNDVFTSDVILVNLLYAETVSIGTVSELAWAHSYKKPTVVAMEEGGLHEHPFVTEFTGFRTHSLSEAIETVFWVLNKL